ncbi:MAG TPA: Holliday junction resolvase RuvX [Candidatus Omnitrophica bacterium]|nr:Holliday junction resolvase RuvX [Candidatus Omnitrophota bacterium]
MSRVLGIDLGEKRVGIAISDPLGIFAQGLDVLNIRGRSDLLNKLLKYFNSYEIAEVVIGNPLDKMGRDCRRSIEIKKIAELIFSHYNVKVKLWDERFSTKEAEKSLQEFGKKKFQKHVDKVSAQIILQSYLERVRDERLL